MRKNLRHMRNTHTFVVRMITGHVESKIGFADERPIWVEYTKSPPQRSSHVFVDPTEIMMSDRANLIPISCYKASTSLSSIGA